MRLQSFVERLMGATLDDLGSIVASGEVDGVEVSAHGMAVGSAWAVKDELDWLRAYFGCVAHENAEAQMSGPRALAVARMIAAMYGAARGSAADTDAAARLVWRIAGGSPYSEWELRSSSAAWIVAPAGVALWDGTYEDGERRVWASSWAEVLERVAAVTEGVEAAWTDGGDDDE